MKNDYTKTIYVYENWSAEQPVLLGYLYIDSIRGSELYSFEYDKKWLSKADQRLLLDPELSLFAGRQYPINKKMYKLPLLIAEEAGILANLYVYKYDLFRKQIEETEINQFTYDQILGRLLVLINVYDLNGDEEFLALAERLLKRLQEFATTDYVTLNLLQIKERRVGLDETDKVSLMEMNDDDIYKQFGKSVLLKDKTSAETWMAKFTSKEKEEYETYPINTLFRQLQRLR